MSQVIHAQAKAVQKPSPTASRAGVLQRQCACSQHAFSGEHEDCREKKGILQRASFQSPPQDGSVPPIVHNVLRSQGHPLDGATSAFFGQRFGYDFSNVRVHTDARAAESAKAVNALAYTSGHDVVFGSGQFKPETPRGQRLLAHELTHVVQQRSFSACKPVLSRANDEHEREAERSAAEVLSGSVGPKSIPARATGVASGTIQRFSESEHIFIGEMAYKRALPQDQASSGDQPKNIDKEFLTKLRTFDYQSPSGKHFNYGRMVAMADNIASFELMEQQGRERAQTRVPLLSPIWDWIGDTTHYLDLAARNRAHFHPHNYMAWQSCHRQALKIMSDAWRKGQEADRLKGEVTDLLARFNEHDQKARKVIKEIDRLVETTGRSGEHSSQIDDMEKEVSKETEEMRSLLSRAEKKQQESRTARLSANDMALRAMAYNGFADHFLTDAFAAGHIVTPRTALLDQYSTRLLGFIPTGGVLHCANIPSLAWHDLDNKFGVEVENKAGSRWRTYGDDYGCGEKEPCPDPDKMPGGRSLPPTIEHVVAATAASVRQMWEAASGNAPSDFSPVLNQLPSPTWDRYPGWSEEDWNIQLRYAAGEEVGLNYGVLGLTGNPPSGEKKEEPPNPKGHQLGSGILSFRAGCLNLIDVFNYKNFVLPMLSTIRKEYDSKISKPVPCPAAQESVKGNVVLGSILGGLAGIAGGLAAGFAIGGIAGVAIGIAIGVIGFLAGGFIGGLTGKKSGGPSQS